jgi:hypothetical protein
MRIIGMEERNDELDEGRLRGFCSRQVTDRQASFDSYS